MNETERQTCPQCGKPMPADAPGGLCPSCVMAVNLASETLRRTTEHSNSHEPPPSPQEIAERFPNFEILEYLGRGGMGVVYKARQKTLDREVAIKILAGEWQHDAAFAERFEQEAKTLAQMSHPNIVTVHDFGEADGLYFIVMEFIDGVNLRDLLSDDKMAPEQALSIVPPICDALEYAHGKGVVHRDIKPENLLLDREGRVRIADFGVASIVGDTADNAGTPSYMAPEQASGIVDRRADIYALGVVLYEMLTGERPAKDFVAPSQRVEIDVKIDEMVLRALEVEPERRFQTAGEFRTTAELVLSDPLEGPRPGGKTYPPPQHDEWKSAESGWGWFIGKLFGVTFTSPVAYNIANASALGFLGSLGFLGYLPVSQANVLFALHGLYGLFGLIGMAFILELFSRARRSTPGSSNATSRERKNAAAGPTFNPWERTIAVGGTVFSAAMLFPVAELPSPTRWPVMFLFLAAFSIGVVSLAGFWPFSSPLFPKPNFSSRKLAQGDEHPNGRDGIFACLAAVGLLLLSATGDAGAMLVGAGIMLIAELVFYSGARCHQALLISLASMGVAAVVVIVALGGHFSQDSKLPDFGPVEERFLTVDTSDTSYYSFERGFVPGPTDFDPSDERDRGRLWKWLTEHHVDVFARARDGHPTVVRSEMVTLDLDEEAFDQLSASELTNDSGWQSVLKAQARSQESSTLSRGRLRGNRDTFAFQTRFEKTGLLQVVGVSETPPGVKIRYKLVQESSDSAASTASGARKQDMAVPTKG